MPLRQREKIQELLRAHGVRTYRKRRSTAALQDESDRHVLEIPATFWSAVVLYRFNRLRAAFA